MKSAVFVSKLERETANEETVEMQSCINTSGFVSIDSCILLDRSLPY